MKNKEIQTSTLDGSWSRRLVREPLVHFLLLGGLLFRAYYAFIEERIMNNTRLMYRFLAF